MKNNKTWTIVTLFWDDGSGKPDRLRNAKFSINNNSKLVEFLNKNGCDVTYKIYDFSPEKLIVNSTHIPFKLGEYKRSEKINIVLNTINSDFFSVIDSDCFFYSSNYYDILTLYNTLDIDNVYNFDWRKLNDIESLDFLNNTYTPTSNWNYAMGNDQVGGLGAFFIVPTNKLKQIGGFNEQIITWGGEDGEVLDRLLKITKRICIYDISPIHIPHYTDWGNKLYYNNG